MLKIHGFLTKSRLVKLKMGPQEVGRLQKREGRASLERALRIGELRKSGSSTLGTWSILKISFGVTMIRVPWNYVVN